jgi:CHAT domain-containing protein
MERFYDNLWQKGMGKGEALRQAQVALLRHPELIRGGDQRDLKLGDARQLPQGGAPQTRTHAALWAAFVLSGDWR